MAGDRVPLILDVDTGIDDALALLYACGSPDAELVAVTCLSGNAALEDTQRNTRAVLELAGRGDVEVAAGRAGAAAPRARDHARDARPARPGLRGAAGADGALSARFGPDLIVEEARRRPGEITLVTLGPLTNLAIAVLIEPALPRLLRRWVCMGGAFRVPGNTTPVSEWNVHCDPEAARSPSARGRRRWTRTRRRPRAVARPRRHRAGPLTSDDVVALARRAGSRPDDSLDPGASPARPSGGRWRATR